MPKDKQLQGLGGWLIVVGLNVVSFPILMVASVYPLYVALFSEGSLTAVTKPGSASYHPLWEPLLFAEAAVSSAFALVSFSLALLFFSKDRLFPKLYAGFLVSVAVFSLADSLAVHMIDPTSSIFNQGVMQLFGIALIWGSYMLVSERVKLTFVHSYNKSKQKEGNGDSHDSR